MKTTFTLIFALFSLAAYAQRNFVPGQYTTLQGEVIQAHIDDQNWERYPKTIEVKQDLNSSEIKQLHVSEIRGFSLSTGDRFESYILDIDKSPIQINQMSVGSPAVIEQDTVFLRVLVQGKASLYLLKDEEDKKHFFIKMADELPQELIYRASLVDNWGKVMYSRPPIYRGLLNVLLTDCPEVSSKISKAVYNESSLKEIVTKYNQCLGGTEGDYTSKEEKILLNLFLLGGANYSSLEIESNAGKYINGSDYRSSSYTFGASVLATLPRGRQKWAIQADLMYKPFKVDHTYIEGKPDADIYRNVQSTFDLDYLGLNTALRYTLLADALVKPYLSLGIANNFVINENNSQIQYEKFYSSSRETKKEPIEEIRRHEQAVIIGVGIDTKKVLAELKLEKGNGFSPFVTMKTARNTLSFTVGYKLK